MVYAFTYNREGTCCMWSHAPYTHKNTKLSHGIEEKNPLPGDVLVMHLTIKYTNIM